MPAGAEFRYRNRAVSDSAVDIVEETVYISSIRICNRTGSAATITIKDRDTVPFEYYEAVSIPANSVVNERIKVGSMPPAGGLKFVNGINLDAGTDDALTIEIFGWYPGA